MYNEIMVKLVKDAFRTGLIIVKNLFGIRLLIHQGKDFLCRRRNNH